MLSVLQRWEPCVGREPALDGNAVFVLRTSRRLISQADARAYRMSDLERGHHPAPGGCWRAYRVLFARAREDRDYCP